MAQFPVTQNSACIFQAGYSQATTIRNIGANPVYLDSSINVNPGSSYPLGPGATLQWDAGQALYVVADPGLTSTLVTVTNSGNLFDPVSIGTAILNGGLAAQIAAAITLNGAPPIDVNAVVISQINVAPPLFAPANYDVDVSRYQSVFVYINETPNLVGAAAPQSVRQISLLWSIGFPPSGSMPTVHVDTFYTVDNNGYTGPVGTGYTTFRGPVRSAKLRVSIPQNSASSRAITVVVIGSYKTVTETKYNTRSAYGVASVGLNANPEIEGDPGDNFVGLYAPTLAGGALVKTYPNVKSGLAYIITQAQAGAVATTFRAYLLPLNTTSGSGPFINQVLYDTGLLPVAANAIVTTTVEQVIFPNYPVYMQMSAGSGALTTCRFAITNL